MSVWTPEQERFDAIRRSAVFRARTVYRNAEDFNLVRKDGRPIGWTFHTGNYPNTSFGWVTLGGRIGAADHDVRLLARKDLKERGDQ